MHPFDLLGILFIAIWVIGGLAIFRESRQHTGLVRLMAVFAIVLGPLGMLVYLGFRYVGQAIQMRPLLPFERQRHLP